uniref:Ig-like domain-containing protein n=1 Tax=Dicentrarchus labrax TaxID=13489 RepID=A0A8C4DEF2_DICLA
HWCLRKLPQTFEREITAEAGLCAVIPCSFTPGYGFTVSSVVWFKCEPSKPRCVESDIIFRSNKNRRNIQSGFEGRVSLLDPDVSLNNCSIIINDITESDSGSYQLRVNGIRYRTTDGFTFSPRATVSVKDLTQKPTVMIPLLTEGQHTTLTCTAPGLCSGSRPKITWMWRGTGENHSHITGNITEFKTENLTAVTQRHSSTLTFNPSAEHHGTSVTCKVSFTNNITTEETVTLNVTFKITGNTSAKEGETLNLTCSVESFPPALITWTKLSDKNMQNGTKTCLQEESGMGTFTIHKVTTKDSGQYICTAKHLNNTLKETKPIITGNTTVEWGQTLNLTCSVESFPPSRITWSNLGSNTNLLITLLIIVLIFLKIMFLRCCDSTCVFTVFPKILKHSGCKVQSEVLTCMCISEGLPLPTIRWPLLKNHTEYSFITTVSSYTVNSTVSLSVKDHSNTVVECVSSNEIGEAKENLTVQTDLLNVSYNLCCTCQIDVGQAVEDDQTYYQEAAEDGEGVGEPKDVQYATIDFSVLKRRSPREAANAQETTETEYAEIKKAVKEERKEEERGGEEEENEVLDGKEEDVMIGEDEETKQHAPEEDEGEDTAVYSSVKDIMGEI